MSESESPNIPNNQQDENIFGTPIVPSPEPLDDITDKEEALFQSVQRSFQRVHERAEEMDTTHTPPADPDRVQMIEDMEWLLADYANTHSREDLNTSGIENPFSQIRGKIETWGVDYDTYIRELVYQQSKIVHELSSIADTETIKTVVFPTVLRLTQEKLYEQKKAKELEHKLYNDPLTNLLNSNYFIERLPETVEHLIKTDRPIALFFIDTDGFKEVNDVYGHETGDDALQSLAETIHETVRDLDIVIRRSGDEFVVVLDNVDEQEAAEIAERIRAGARAAKVRGIPDEVTPPDLSFSIGIATSKTASSHKEFVEQAEIAMHNSKRDMQGNPQKDKVTSYVPGMVTPPGGEKGRNANTDTTAQE
jgi:diguanylate cyclase (GGDEF)-like protein